MCGEHKWTASDRKTIGDIEKKVFCGVIKRLDFRHALMSIAWAGEIFLSHKTIRTLS